MGASLHGPGSEGANLVDASTGLASRLLFADRVDHALARSERTDGVFSVVLVDVGGSPDLAVDAGVDDLLAVAARRLRGAVRSPDTVARVGDRQFAVLLEGADRQMAEDVGRRISDTLRDPIPVGGRRCVLSVDIGVVVARGYASAEDVLHNAGVALRAAGPGGNPSFGAAMGSPCSGIAKGPQVPDRARSSTSPSCCCVPVRSSGSRSSPTTDASSCPAGAAYWVRWRRSCGGWGRRPTGPN